MLTLKVFLSSPGDVAEERRIAMETMRALEDSPLLRERVNLQVIAWDDPAASAPLDARETPQASVNRWAGRPADCDLTIAILWSRLGTPLPAGLKRADGSRFASGTVWEVEDAIAADRPVFVYRRTDKPRIELDDAAFDARRAQYDAVRRWFDGLRDADGAWRSGVNEYAGPAQFQQLLRAHLEAFIGRRLAEQTPASANASPRAPAASPSPAPHLAPHLAPAPAAAAPGRPAWLMPAGVGALLVAGALAWGLRPGGKDGALPPSVSPGTAPDTQTSAQTSTSTSPPPAAAPLQAGPAAALPQVRLAGPTSLSFTTLRGSTYTVLALTPEPGTSGNWQLRLKVRLSAGAGSGGMNFWDSAFRLVVDGVPRAPVSTLNELVEGGAAKDGELVFSLPYAMQTLALRVRHYAEVGELPLAVSGTQPPLPPALLAGPRKVSLGAPAELNFPRSPHTRYTVLAVGTENRRPGVFGLRLLVRMLVVDGPDANFGDGNFRLLVDGVPRAPDSGLNLVVGGGAALEGEVAFEVPADAKQLTLRLINSAEASADLPLTLEPAK